MVPFNSKIFDESLCLLQGISKTTEIALYNKGIVNCKHLIDRAEKFFSPRKVKIIRSSYCLIQKAISCNMLDVLINRLPVGVRSRAIYAAFNQVLFFDIETDGLGRSASITCITAFFRGKVTTYVRGINLLDFLDVWSQADILVSFNGKKFDTPIVARTFGLSRIPAQVDLMNEAACYGLKGGLKAIEPYIGFHRKCKKVMDGKGACESWRAYCKGDREQLDLLKAYNQEDVLSLYSLYRYLLRRSVENTPIRIDL